MVVIKQINKIFDRIKVKISFRTKTQKPLDEQSKKVVKNLIRSINETLLNNYYEFIVK